MRNVRFVPVAAVWVGIAVAAVAGGIASLAAAQTPADSEPRVPRFIKVVQPDACNACVQARGCGAQSTKCNDHCASTYPPNDPRGAKCLAACSRLQDRCVRESHKACQACQP
jgi:hypothetical protein